MKILFLTLLNINDLTDKNIYTDLLREFIEEGHEVDILSPIERRNWNNSPEVMNKNIFKVKILNITKTNLIEKGLSTLTIDRRYLKTIKMRLNNKKYDLVIYSTPPITFTKTIGYLKKTTNAINYLLLKDIFPQNAVDLGMINKNGFIYKFFKRKEKKLYSSSDAIGCMSPRNAEYLLAENKELKLENKVHISPNTIEVKEPIFLEKEEIQILKRKFNLPENKNIFVYGGNIGKPQGIDFFLDCIKDLQNKNNKAYFVIVGSGTEFERVKKYSLDNKLNNLQVIDNLPVEDFNKLLSVSDVGLVLLDYRFTIPNFPSRLLSYMQEGLPILAATDISSDVGSIVSSNGFGYWVNSNNKTDFIKAIDAFESKSKEDIQKMGLKSYDFLINNYTSKHSYEIIIKEVERKEENKNV